MVGVATVKASFRQILSELSPKHLVVGVAVFFATGWVISRVLPGAAFRMGLTPRPLLPDYQNDWPEPFGLEPLLPSLMKKTAPASTSTSSGASQESLGRAIIAATQAALPASSGDILANITSGNA
jgi:hypothetical protein